VAYQGKFDGFPAEGLQFLEELSINNNREWFQARKPLYQEQVLEPAQAFVTALGAQLQTISIGIQYDTRTDGRGSIMRIYRDVRFSKDKTPYEPNVRLVFWEGNRKKTECPGFFLRLDGDGVGLYVGLHGFIKPVLTAYRDAVADEAKGAQLDEALVSVRAAGAYEIGGEHYKRVPQGYDTGHQRADLLRYNGLWAKRSLPDPSQALEPGFVDVCFEQFRNMAPIQQWLVKIDQLAGETSP
jgi:uncharacterized protein (TIGR02453 family)